MKISYKIILMICLSYIISSCKDDSTNNPTIETGIPVIQSLTSDKSQIMFGGSDPATLTCIATGGNLTYKWEVDLGDIIPVKSDKSIVSFNGAACCVGEKIIKCTVSNSLGSTSKEVKVFILEEIKVPEIISLESNKSQLSKSANEKADLVCFAIGGNLSYKWEVDCGELTVNQTDKSKVIYTPKTDCNGTVTVKCTISNEKGSAVETFKINVVN